MLSGVRTTIFLLSLTAALFAGCKNDSPASTPPPRTSTPEPRTDAVAPQEIPKAESGRPQPRLVTLKLWVGTNEVTSEIAYTMPQIMAGMMWRTNMPENTAMIFVFDYPASKNFYMRNCVVPLSAGYIQPDGALAEIAKLVPGDQVGVQSKSENLQFVLEVPQGWFERHNVKTGAVIRTEKGSLLDTFFPKR